MGQKPVKVEVLNVTEYVKKEEAAEDRLLSLGMMGEEANE